MKCPMCGYERRPEESAPAWQCPSCQVAYVKAAEAAAKLKAEPAIVPGKAAAALKPIPPSDAASRRERARQQSEAVAADIREWQAARGQKILIYCILLNFLLGAIERTRPPPDLVMIALYIVVAAWSLLGVVRICSGLQKSQGRKILFMVLTFFPLINLVTLVYLSVKATRMLREAGWSVGLFGARP